MAQLRRLEEMFPDELVVIGVHSAKFPSEQLTASIREAVRRSDIRHPVVNDAGFKIWNAYAVRAWPTLVLIDPHGRIAGEVSGEILAEEFAANIREVIEQDPGAVNREPLSDNAPAQPEVTSPLRYPSRVLLAGDRMFIADTGSHRVLEIALDGDGMGGEVLRVFGSGDEGFQDGTGAEAAFRSPHGLGLRGSERDGTLFVADTENHAIRAIDLSSGAIRTIAGTGQKAHGRKVVGSPTATPLRSPWAVLPLDEYLFIAMAGSHQVWVLADDVFGPFAGNGVEDLVDGPVGEASFNQPSDLAYAGGYLFVADPEASAIRAITLVETPRVMTLVGKGLFDWGDQDGATDQALLQHSLGISFQDGQIYIADTYNNKIKMLDPAAGQVRTLLGSGQPGSADGDFDRVRLFEPEGVQAHDGRLYIADTNNHLIRVADLETRRVSVFALRRLHHLQRKNMGEERQITLPAADVQPGKVQVTLDIRLPSGYLRSADAPLLLVAGAEPVTVRRSYAAGEPVTFAVDLNEEQNLPIQLSVYFCRAGQPRLCLIHNASLVLPLRAQPGAPAEVVVPWEVPEPRLD